MKEENLNVLKRLSNFITAIFLIVVSTILTTELKNFSETFEGTGINAGIVPKCVIIGLYLVAALLLISGIKELREFAVYLKERKNKISSNMKKEIYDDDGNAVEISALRWNLSKFGVLLSIIAFGAYVFLFKPLGYLLASMLYIAAQSLLLSLKVKRNYWAIGITVIVAPLVAYLFFAKGFGVILPKGIFFE